MIISEALNPGYTSQHEYSVKCDVCGTVLAARQPEADLAAEVAYRRGWGTRRLRPMHLPLSWLCGSCRQREPQA